MASAPELRPQAIDERLIQEMRTEVKQHARTIRRGFL